MTPQMTPQMTPRAMSPLTLLALAWRSIARLPRRSAGAVAGTALSVGLLSAVLFFVDASAHAMTGRALSGVSVDMQAAIVGPGLPVDTARATIARYPDVRVAERFARAPLLGSSLQRGATLATGGAGALVAVDPSYPRTFDALRIRAGAFRPDGVLLSQDMGTNLGARVGDVVTLALPGAGGAYRARVAGIINITRADALFQPTDPAAQAASFKPPVDVVVMDYATFARTLRARLASAAAPASAASGGVVQQSGSALVEQVHIALDRAALPDDPAAAQARTLTLRRTMEKAFPGQLQVVNNVGSALDALKGDITWATVLVIFLALPGVAVAAYLTREAAAALALAQRREFALLRARGLGPRAILTLAAFSSALLALGGALVGLALGWLVALWAAGSSLLTPQVTGLVLQSAALAALGALLLSAATTYLPLRAMLAREVAVERRAGQRERPPLWRRLYLDILALVGAAIVYQVTQVNGFHPVLTGEGNTALSLSLYTFLAPLLFWLGAVGLILRAGTALLRRRGGPAGLLGRLFGPTGDVAGRAVARRAAALGRTGALAALALSFGISLAVFANTYDNQQRVDAQLTLGSDVKVTPGSRAPQTAAFAARLAAAPGVTAVTPFKTTVAYVGTEIQDIFGVDAPSFRRASFLADSFFRGLTARQAMDRLAATPDGIIISDEMARDFSIAPGDLVRLRLYNTPRHVYVTTPFHVVGVASEFATAPKDAFLVVNQSALVAATGDPRIDFFLARAAGDAASADRGIQAALAGGPAVTTQTIDTVAAGLSTSLTALNLRGLTTIELAYTIAILTAGVLIALLAGLTERRGEFAALRAIGASGRQMGAFVASEALLVAALALVAGAAVGAALGSMLVTILTSIFDPPPAGPIAPWGTLALLLVLAAGGIALGAAVAMARLRRLPVAQELRGL